MEEEGVVQSRAGAATGDDAVPSAVPSIESSAMRIVRGVGQLRKDCVDILLPAFGVSASRRSSGDSCVVLFTRIGVFGRGSSTSLSSMSFQTPALLGDGASASRRVEFKGGGLQTSVVTVVLAVITLLQSFKAALATKPPECERRFGEQFSSSRRTASSFSLLGLGAVQMFLLLATANAAFALASATCTEPMRTASRPPMSKQAAVAAPGLTTTLLLAGEGGVCDWEAFELNFRGDPAVTSTACSLVTSTALPLAAVDRHSEEIEGSNCSLSIEMSTSMNTGLGGGATTACCGGVIGSLSRSAFCLASTGERFKAAAAAAVAPAAAAAAAAATTADAMLCAGDS